MLEKDVFLSPVEKELRFKEWCQRNGVKRFLFDGDDTLWSTGIIFRQFLSQSYDYLSSITAVPQKVWEDRISQIDNNFFEKYGVNFERYNFVMEELAGVYNLPESVWLHASSILKQIYYTPPKFLEGAEKTLDFIKKTKEPFGIVTHANHDWTARKYHWLNLKRFLDWDDIFIIDENGHKTEAEWKKATEYFGCQPNEVVVVGDSPRSDINPAQKLGVRHLFLVEGSIPRWSIHNQEIDPQVMVIKDLTGLISQVISDQTTPLK